jgi:tetratricopeptide (TPR) repeat protein
LETALASHQQGHLDKALILYRQSLAHDPGHSDSLHLLGLLLHQWRADKAALPLVRRAIASRPGFGPYYANLGTIAHAQSALEAALAAFRAAIAIEPGTASLYFGLANVCRDTGREEDAVILYGTAVLLNSGYVEARANRADVLRGLRRFPEAAADYLRAAVLMPTSAIIWLRLGSIQHDLGDFHWSRRAYLAALAITPHSLDAKLGMAAVDRVLGNPEAAVRACEDFLGARADVAAAHSVLGKALADLNRLDEAILRYRTALSLKPDLADAVCDMSGALFGLGRAAEAVVFSARGLRLDGVKPDNLAGGGALAPAQVVRFENAMLLEAASRETCDWAGGLAPFLRSSLPVATRFNVMAHQLIGLWAARRLADVGSLLQALDDVAAAIGDWSPPNLDNMRRYCNFILGLAKSSEGRADSAGEFAPVTILGDSHCLSYAGVVVDLGQGPRRVRSDLVMGAKAWHLGNGQANRYKWRFRSALDRVSPGSVVLCAFGEIDCRIHDGIIPHLKRTGADLDEVLAGQIDSYVDFVVAETERRHVRPTFLGVPAPHVTSPTYPFGDADKEDRALLIEVVRAFNQSLQRRASNLGAGFVDLYKLTADPDGLADGQWHVDDFHLRSGALIAAIIAQSGRHV